MAEPIRISPVPLADARNTQTDDTDDLCGSEIIHSLFNMVIDRVVPWLVASRDWK